MYICICIHTHKYICMCIYTCMYIQASQVAQWVKNLPAMQKTHKMQVEFLGREDPLEEGMATYFSILAWRIPRTEEPGGLQSIGLQRVRHVQAVDKIVMQTALNVYLHDQQRLNDLPSPLWKKLFWLYLYTRFNTPELQMCWFAGLLF